MSTLSSMTGFARRDGVLGSLRWVWELKTVNARGLDARIRVPPGFDAVEPAARAAIGAAIGRGTCHANLSTVRADRAPVMRINEDALEAVIGALARLRGRVEAAPPSLDGILAIRGVLDIVEPEDSESERAEQVAAIGATLDLALADLVAARRAEGAALAAVLGQRLDEIAGLTARAEDCPARRPEMIRRRIEDGVAALLDGTRALDPDRLHQEAMLLASRADIREELDRLKAHVAAARDMLAKGGAVGRRLDFLSQELGRESNTLCAKSNDVSLTAIGLELKTVVEQFREQVQNLE